MDYVLARHGDDVNNVNIIMQYKGYGMAMRAMKGEKTCIRDFHQRSRGGCMSIPNHLIITRAWLFNRSYSNGKHACLG